MVDFQFQPNTLNGSKSSGENDETSPRYGFACVMDDHPNHPSAHPTGSSPNKESGGRPGAFLVG